MTYAVARLWLIKNSLLIMAFFGSALLVAPATRYPLSFEQAISLLQIVLPLFIGYLSTAIVFLTSREAPLKRGPAREFSSILAHLVKGPVWLVALFLSIALIVFGIVNWPKPESQPSGFDFGLLSNLVSFILSISAATTSALVAWLFKVETESAR
jgi:hypothetical protein